MGIMNWRNVNSEMPLRTGKLVIKDCKADAYLAEYVIDSRRIFGGG